MGLKKLVFLLLSLPVVALGQYHITGKITDILTKKPVANASVFLSSASTGTKTNDDGTYDISNVRGGHYDLVVSIIGYVTYHQDVAVNNNISLPNIEIEAKTIALKEVRIGPDVNWDRNYAMFKRQFLGSSDKAGDCKILNPQVIDISYDPEKRVLEASSTDFVEIENKFLGYKIKYLLSTLNMQYSGFGNGGALYFEGSPLFEDLPGKKSQLEKWQRNRKDTYMASEMHFLRSVISNKVAEEGFTVRRLIRKPDPDYPLKSSKKYTETLVSTPLAIADYVKLTDQPGEYALVFPDCLYITYHVMPGSKYQTSILTLAERYVFFDNNGIIINPRSVVLEEAWGNSRMPEMLPVDYEPPVK